MIVPDSLLDHEVLDHNKACLPSIRPHLRRAPCIPGSAVGILGNTRRVLVAPTLGYTCQGTCLPLFVSSQPLIRQCLSRNLNIPLAVIQSKRRGNWYQTWLCILMLVLTWDKLCHLSVSHSSSYMKQVLERRRGKIVVRHHKLDRLFWCLFACGSELHFLTGGLGE